MYKPLLFNKLIVLGVSLCVMIVFGGGMQACSPFPPMTGKALEEQPLRGTWQGVAFRKTDSSFFKMTFLPDLRYHLFVLSLPAGTLWESSGVLRAEKRAIYFSAFADWKLERLAASPQQPPLLRLLTNNNPLDLVILAPFNEELTEKVWAMVAKSDTLGDTLYLDKRNPLLLRFRADNFDIQSLSPEPGLWGYYVLKENSIYIRPLDNLSSAPAFPPEDWYSIILADQKLVLRSHNRVSYVFERKLFR
ncbi:MAG: hypothetical protein ACP5O2_07795 [Bacteroidales bacterium]